MRLIYRYMVILCLFFIVPDTLRADGEDVLERMISLPKMKGTVYSLLGNISQQSGYLFIYDSKVVDNDVTVKIRKGERTIRQAIYEITGDTSLEFKVIGTHILITSSSPTKQQQAKPSSVHPVNLMLTGTLLDKETGMPVASASVGVGGHLWGLLLIRKESSDFPYRILCKTIRLFFSYRICITNSGSFCFGRSPSYSELGTKGCSFTGSSGSMGRSL